MSLHTKLLLAAILAVFVPDTIGAQEKQRKFEINVGISSPGLHCRADRDIAGFEFHLRKIIVAQIIVISNCMIYT